MRLVVQDLRTSTIRKRAVRLGRPDLWAFYQELLWALYEAGGELSADPLTLHEELDFWSPEQIKEMLPLLSPSPGRRGGITIDNGIIHNNRVSEDLLVAQEYLDQQAARGSLGGRAKAAATLRLAGATKKVSSRLASAKPRVPTAKPPVATAQPELSLEVEDEDEGEGEVEGEPPSHPPASREEARPDRPDPDKQPEKPPPEGPHHPPESWGVSPWARAVASVERDPRRRDLEAERGVLEAYWIALGGRPTRQDRRALLELLQGGHTVAEVRTAIAGWRKDELIRDGTFDYEAPWPPPELEAELERGER